MTDYTMAADALKRMAVQYKNIVAVAEALESLGSIQGAAKEADAALAKARKDRDAFVAKFAQEMAKCKGDLAIAQAAADKTIADTKQQTDDLKKSTLLAAEKKAQKIVSDALDAADKTLAKANANKTMADDAYSLVNDSITSRSLDLDRITKDVAEAQSQYDKLEKALATLKAKFA